MGNKGSGQVIGYQYHLGIDFAWCHGPVDFVENFYVDNKPLNVSLFGAGGTTDVNLPELFGETEGGLAGTITLEDGNETQVANAYLVEKIDGSVPAYRGVTRTVHNGSSSVDASRSFYVGNNPYLKKWTAEIQRIEKRMVDGVAVDQWQLELANVPRIGGTQGGLISATLGDQSIFFNADLSSLSNGYEGDNGTIDGIMNVLLVKSKIINSLLFIKNRATYNRETRGIFGKLGAGLSGLDIGVGYFRFTDGASNNASNFPATWTGTKDQDAVDEAPLPTDVQKTANTYSTTYNFPKSGYMMFENATAEDIDTLIAFVTEFVVVPDNVPDGERYFNGTMSSNVSGAYTGLGTDVRRSHIVFTSLNSDDTVNTRVSFGNAINAVLDAGVPAVASGEPAISPHRAVLHGPITTVGQAINKNILSLPSDLGSAIV